MFAEVGLPEGSERKYPHELSGGQKQRVMIALALACNPKVLLADEPTTALDVTVQRDILDLLQELRDARGLGVLFVTHDLDVVKDIADHVVVMRHGEVVESGTCTDVMKNVPPIPTPRNCLPPCRRRRGTQTVQMRRTGRRSSRRAQW